MAGGQSGLIPIRLQSQPGIKRDGTTFDGDNYTDGRWVRFQRSKPRKIGGYRRLSDQLSEVSRGLHVQSRNNLNFLHSGYYGGLDRLTLDSLGSASVITDRTPVGFPVDVANQWQFDVMFNSASSGAQLMAHSAPNGSDISSSVETPVYLGDIYGTALLTAVPGIAVSGGIVVLHPYLFAFGNDGSINWSRPGLPAEFTGTGSGTARATGQKIVRGMPLRAGAGNSPSGLFWSLDSVIRASFTGGTTIFSFDTISSQSSILSAASVIEYDGIYFWCGVDRFLMFNGVVREVPNQLNLNWFFDNLNYVQRSKVFAFKVPRFGEIWWCYPRGSATECTHAVIFNVRENIWYDTPLPGGGRSAAQYAQVFKSPIATGVDLSGTKYKLWQHEFGFDEVDGASVTAVQSYFTTADMSMLTSDQPADRSLRIECIEPDFVQSGEMSVTVLGRANARSPDYESAPRVITAASGTSDPTQQLVFLREQRRQMRLKFSSETIGGNYEMGQVIAHIAPADGKEIG